MLEDYGWERFTLGKRFYIMAPEADVVWWRSRPSKPCGGQRSCPRWVRFPPLPPFLTSETKLRRGYSMKLSKLQLIRAGFILSLAIALVLAVLDLSWAALAVVCIAVISLVFMVRWHARNSMYVCPECDHKFRITPWIDFISPHTFEKKWLTCPSCSKESWCHIH